MPISKIGLKPKNKFSLDSKKVEIKRKKQINLSCKGRFSINSNVNSEVVVTEKFLNSVHLENIKFTNYVNLLKNVDNSHLVFNLDFIQTNIDYIIDNAKQINFNKRAQKIPYILNEYCKNWNEIKIAKVNGIKTSTNGEHQNTFRVYMQVDVNPGRNTEYQLLFCDIYHLAIPATHYSNKGIKSKATSEHEMFLRNKYNHRNGCQLKDFYQNNCLSK